MAKPKKIWDKVYQIGSADRSQANDCCIYFIDAGNDATVMIDSGTGQGFDTLVKNIGIIGFSPKNVKALILTHCHIDHIGSANRFKTQFNCEIIAHEKDADAIEGRNIEPTVASWYGVKYSPVSIDRLLSKDVETLTFGDVSFVCLHTPGHTPGSISVYCDINGKRVLFGQDIHGPFDASFGSSMDDWRRSMLKLRDLKADILCEGHCGTYLPEDEIRRYIEGYVRSYCGQNSVEIR